MAAYYNENDPKAAAWLRELIKAGLIADGEVDERSIADVRPDELRGFTQCHFFAGIGGWSYALRLAGWPDDRSVWTGSCPCQPWSSAGAGLEADDPRDLWPAWFELASVSRPATLLGEQVAQKAGRAWLDRLYDDLEGIGYAVGAVALPACSVGAFHIRQRLWFVADAAGVRAERLPAEGRGSVLDRPGSRQVGDLADTKSGGLGIDRGAQGHARHVDERITAGGVADAHSVVSGEEWLQRGRPELQPDCDAATSPWDSVEWLECRDGKARPIEPGLEPLAYGIPARMGRLRGYGNAIVPQVAAEVIGAYMDICDDLLAHP
jgi:DNA (cytosine-5)-methyltransferase 1